MLVEANEPAVLEFAGPVEVWVYGRDIRHKLLTTLEFGLVRRFFKVIPEGRRIEVEWGRLLEHVQLVAEEMGRGTLNPPPLFAGLMPWQKHRVSWAEAYDRGDEGSSVTVSVENPLPLLPEYDGIGRHTASPDLEAWYTFRALEILRIQSEAAGDLIGVRRIEQTELPICVILDSQDSESLTWRASRGES